jgi:hypothetical protein
MAAAYDAKNAAEFQAVQQQMCASCLKMLERVRAFVNGLSTALVLASVGTPTDDSTPQGEQQFNFTSLAQSSVQCCQSPYK